MGEEWGSKSPFYYFCDLSAELAQSVTEGRRGEFAKFPQFADEKARKNIPDPCAAQTFEKSKLPWNERDQSWHKEILNHYRHLLAVRKEEIVPKLLHEHLHPQPQGTCQPATYDLFGEKALAVAWSMASHSRLMLFANLDDKNLHTASGAKLKEVLSRHNEFMQGRVIFESHKDSLASLASGKMKPWSVVWLFA